MRPLCFREEPTVHTVRTFPVIISCCMLSMDMCVVVLQRWYTFAPTQLRPPWSIPNPHSSLVHALTTHAFLSTFSAAVILLILYCLRRPSYPVALSSAPPQSSISAASTPSKISTTRLNFRAPTYSPAGIIDYRDHGRNRQDCSIPSASCVCVGVCVRVCWAAASRPLSIRGIPRSRFRLERAGTR
jgi:hypothetical protein